MNGHGVHENDGWDILSLIVSSLINFGIKYKVRSKTTRSRLNFNKMKIQELSKQSGIHLGIHSRLLWKMGLMLEPKRLANGYRDYDEASLKQLKFIKPAER